MNDTLKVAGRIGAELGAAKAELERLSHKLERARDHLTHARHDVEIRANAGNDAARLVLKGIDQWLSDYDQSPTDTFTAVDMATAAAQGFRDGQAAVEPAPAQDTLMAGCLLPPRMICEDGYPSDDYLMSTAYNRALDDVAALNATCSQPASAQDEREECGCTAERRLVGEGCHVCNLDDDIHQLAFEVGDPADDASGYWFDMESFSEFVEKLLPVIREPYEDVLRALACTLGAGGYNAPTVDPSVFEQKIRWGIDQLTRHTQTEQQPIEGIHRNAYPAKCPVTGLPYFMHLEHPELGVIPTFGGPYDSYSIPHAEGSPDEPWHQRELVSHRYCHDRGHWVDDEFIPLRIIHEDVLSELQDSAAPIAQTAPQHPDDAAVDRFAAAMKAKLAKSRAKGRGGWDDPNVCSVEFLAKLLVEHLGKGNAGTFEDVANFAMMLHQRGADPMVLAEAAEAPIKKARGEALELGVRALESKSEHTEPAPAQDELDPIEKAALDARLRRDFEARWPVPKGVIWGAAVGDYCLSEFAQGIALSYPDMWMAYKAGSERGKA